MTGAPTPTQSPASGAPPAGGAATPAPAVPASGSVASPPTPATPSRPDWLPETYWDGAGNAPKSADIAAALKEAEEFRAARAAVPETADKYSLDLPKDFKLPEGFEVKADDPRIGMLREAAKEAGLDQTKFTQMFAKLAQADAAAQKAQQDLIAQGKAARDEALGPQAAQRIEALHSSFDAMFDADTSKQLKDTLILPKQIEAMEKLVVAVKNGGVPGFNGKGRDAPRTDGKPEGWDGMSPVDRLTWLRANGQ